MSKNGYIGPKIVPGQQLHAFGRYINPDIWDDAEKEKWFSIEPRYKAYFADASGKKNEVTKEAAETKG
jgi:hypothetical protein